MSKKYVLRDGCRISGVNPQEVGEELERLRIEKGGLRPPEIVDAARPKDSPLHPAFTWSDKQAAGKWRLYEARHLTRSVRVIEDEQSEPRTMYVHVRSGDQEEAAGTYQDVATVVSEPDMFADALRSLMSRMHAAKRAVHELEEAAKATDDHDRLARVALAVRAVETAADAVRALH